MKQRNTDLLETTFLFHHVIYFVQVKRVLAYTGHAGKRLTVLQVEGTQVVHELPSSCILSGWA